MRAFHLAALGPGAPDEGPFRSQFDEPLVLPWFLPVGHRSAVAAFMAAGVAATPLPLVEVDWRTGIVASSRRMLEGLHRTGGPTAAVVVVRVRAPEADLDAIARDPALRPFEWLVLSCDGPARGERLGRLRELCGWAVERLAARYDAVCDRVGTTGALAADVQTVARLTMDPVEIANTFNHALELELQETPIGPGEGVRPLRLRLGLDSLGRLPPRALVLLLGILAGRRDDAEEALGDDGGAAERELTSALVLLDGRPTLWAGELADAGHREALGGWQPTAAQRVAEWAERVDAAVAWHRAGGAPRAPAVLSLPEVFRAMRLVDEGRLDEAEALLTTLQEAEPAAPATARGNYWDAVGRLRRMQDRLPEAEAAFTEALRLLEQGGDTPTSRGVTLLEYARLLRDTGRYDEAEAAFKEALRLGEEGGATPKSLAITHDAYALLLDKMGRRADARAHRAAAARLRQD